VLAATVRLQSHFSVAVFAPFDGQDCWDLARDHYGSNTPMTDYDTTDQVIRAVASGEASAGVLALPRADESDPWWPHLLAIAADAPRVVARLPFGALGNARGATDALAIGLGGHQQSGADHTLVAAEMSRDRSLANRAALVAQIALDLEIGVEPIGDGMAVLQVAPEFAMQGGLGQIGDVRRHAGDRETAHRLPVETQIAPAARGTSMPRNPARPFAAGNIPSRNL
jgi:hypothetical protein